MAAPPASTQRLRSLSEPLPRGHRRRPDPRLPAQPDELAAEGLMFIDAAEVIHYVGRDTGLGKAV
jgi:hypothetical protein